MKKKQNEYTVSKESHLKEMNMKIESTKKEMKKQEKAVNALKMKHQVWCLDVNELLGISNWKESDSDWIVEYFE